MKMVLKTFVAPRSQPRNDRKLAAWRSPVSGSEKKRVPRDVRNKEERLNRVRGPAMARPGFER